MIAVRLEEDLEKRLEHLSHETGRSKSYYVKQAIENYLDDREDYLLALSVLEWSEGYLATIFSTALILGSFKSSGFGRSTLITLTLFDEAFTKSISFALSM